MDSPSRSHAFYAGYISFLDKKPKTDNPFSKDAQPNEYTEWLDGYAYADREQQALSY